MVVDGPFGPIPAALFVSRDAEPGAPLVLFGHGACASKDDPIMQVLARSIARGVRGGVVTLDCPGHGDRRPADLTDAQFNALVQANMADQSVFDQLATEWPLVAAASRTLDGRLTGPTAYAGFSMGSVFGFGIVPELHDVGVVLLGVGGLLDEHAPDPVTAALNATRNGIIRAGAERFGDRQVLMTNMTHDEHFPIVGALEVFGLLPGPKRMGVWEGTHTQLSPESMTMAISFLQRHLAQ